MNDSLPRLRAGHIKGTLHVLQAVAPDRVHEIVSRLPRDAQVGLASATGVEFLPAEWDVALVRAIDAVLGRTALRRVARLAMTDSLGGPMLGGLASTAIQIFGTSPAGLFRWGGRAWAHVCRECGEIRLEQSDDLSAELVLVEMPARLVVPVYLEAIGATMEAVLDLCRVDGEVTTEPRQDGARFRAGWRQRTTRAPGR